MRRLLDVRAWYLALLVTGLAAIGAWYAIPRGAAPPGATAPRYVEGVVGAPSRVNPLFAALNPPDADLAALVFEGLVRIAGDGTPRPALAERWEISPDGLTFTFQLRRAVFWQDGEPFTAADVAFTVAQVQAPGFRGPPALAAAWDGIAVAAPDALTVRMTLPAPSAAFLARTALGVLPEHLLRGLGPDALYASAFNRAPVGTGPFRLVRFDDRSAALDRYVGYYGGPPPLPGIDLRYYPDAAAQLAALARGGVSAALLGEAPTDAERAALAARPDVAVEALPLNGYTALYTNIRQAPLSAAALRVALAAAIDRAALVAAATGARGLPGDGPIVPGSWAYAPGEWPPAARADALLDASGWPRGADGLRARGGQTLRLEIETNDDPLRAALANAVAGQLRARGVAATVTVTSASELAARLVARSYQVAIFGWETDVDPDPYGAWHSSQAQPPGRNVAGYRDALADVLMEGARTTLDVGERRDLYARFTQRFVETAPSVVLLYPARAYAHPATLGGLDAGLLFSPADRFRGVARWEWRTP